MQDELRQMRLTKRLLPTLRDMLFCSPQDASMDQLEKHLMATESFLSMTNEMTQVVTKAS